MSCSATIFAYEATLTGPRGTTPSRRHASGSRGSRSLTNSPRVDEGRELAAGREHVFHRGERRSRLREHALEPEQEHALIGGEEVPDDVADGPFVRLRGGPHLVGGDVVAERAQEPRRDRETGDDERLVHGRPTLRPSGRS